MSEPRHNPWDGLCSKWNLGEPTDPEARCPICRPAVRQPASEPASEPVLALADLLDDIQVLRDDTRPVRHTATIDVYVLARARAALAAARGDTP